MDFIKKILGTGLLLVGLIIIFYGIYSSYNIFNAKREAPVIFETAESSVSASGGTAGGLQAQLQETLGEQLRSLMPADSTAQLFNLISWSIFAGILIIGGGQIAGLGIKLLK